MSDELTVEEALKELREMFPDALRVYVSEDADYFDSTLTTEAFVMITHDTFKASTLSGAMALARAFKQSQAKEQGK